MNQPELPDKEPSTGKSKKWEETAVRIEGITDKLGKKIDPGIKEATIAFLVNEFPTRQSCEGHLEERSGKLVKISPYVEVGEKEPTYRYEGEEEIRKKIAEEFNISPNQIGENEKAGKSFWDYIQEHNIQETPEYKETRVKNEQLEKRFIALLAEFEKAKGEASDLRFMKMGSAGRFRIEGAGGHLKGVPEGDIEARRKELVAEQAAMAALTEFMKEKYFNGEE